MKKIMQRTASSDLHAGLTAEAIEQVGGNVFSVTYNGTYHAQGAMQARSKFIVWAKVRDDAMIERADNAIEEALNDLGD